MNQLITLPHACGNHLETAWSLASASVLRAHLEYVEAERDMEHIQHSQDPSVSLWERDRERAEARLQAGIRRLLRLSVSLPEDRPLQRIIILIDRMMDRDDPALPRQLHREMMGCFFRDYQVAGIGPVARHRNELLIQARHQIDAMMRLAYFDYLPDVGIADDVDLPECCP